MRESRTYGSVRGARGNSRPYRERPWFGPKAAATLDGAGSLACAAGIGSHHGGATTAPNATDCNLT
jgi:hypothetical protein